MPTHKLAVSVCLLLKTLHIIPMNHQNSIVTFHEELRPVEKKTTKIAPRPTAEQAKLEEVNRNLLTISKMLQDNQQMQKAFEQRMQMMELTLVTMKEECKSFAEQKLKRKVENDYQLQIYKKQKAEHSVENMKKICVRIEAHEDKVARLLSTFLKQFARYNNNRLAEMQASVEKSFNLIKVQIEKRDDSLKSESLEPPLDFEELLSQGFPEVPDLEDNDKSNEQA